MSDPKNVNNPLPIPACYGESLVQRRSYIIIAAVLIVAVVIGGAVTGQYFLRFGTINQPTTTVQVVAAENFWGSLGSQLGGSRVQVLSIVSDPNADPHDYESNAANARAIADARLVIVNGAGYDDWALRLIAASNSPNQKVLNVADLLGKQPGENPHFWYSPSYVNQTVHAMYSDLVSIDPNSAQYYKQQYSSLNMSLGVYNARINEIRQQYGGRKVASTESIFEYLATAAGLNLISPPEFMDAVAEGRDPSQQSIIQFQNQIKNSTDPNNATLLVYNQQTVTPLTQNMKTMAVQDNIPVVGVTETIQPPDVPFQDWMNAQLLAVQNGLNQGLGQ